MHKFFHELKDAKELFETLASQLGLDPFIVEKDYWVMHCLWGLQQNGFPFELKGGTSLAKGWHCIDRFSEDIDIRFDPPSGLNTRGEKLAHINARLVFYDSLAEQIKIKGILVKRDKTFDDDKGRNGGIRLHYESHFTPQVQGLRTGVLLEVGFDKTTPNTQQNITSWAVDKALEAKLDVIENRANNVKCFDPEYTFVDKLQTICRRFRLHKDRGDPEKDNPKEFLRHYYDLYKLLNLSRVNSFIGTDNYLKYKQEKIKSTGQDAVIFQTGEAFNLSDSKIYELFEKEFESVKKLIWSNIPTFQKVIKRITENASRF